MERGKVVVLKKLCHAKIPIKQMCATVLEQGLAVEISVPVTD